MQMILIVKVVLVSKHHPMTVKLYNPTSFAHTPL
jgi:hypothetical protein